MRSPSGWAKFLRACGAGASRGDLYLLRLALSFIFPDWHYHSSFPIGIIIHLSRLALSFIFPDWHYHSSFPIGIIIHLSRLALSFHLSQSTSLLFREAGLAGCEEQRLYCHWGA